MSELRQIIVPERHTVIPNQSSNIRAAHQDSNNDITFLSDLGQIAVGEELQVWTKRACYRERDEIKDDDTLMNRTHRQALNYRTSRRTRAKTICCHVWMPPLACHWVQRHLGIELDVSYQGFCGA